LLSLEYVWNADARHFGWKVLYIARH
jgi:hypothetical protein